jgi:hypothetical protein
MLSYFLVSVFSSRLISLDIGTAYFKIAELSLSGEPTPIRNKQTGDVPIPAAVAFKKSTPFKHPIGPDNMANVEIKYGSQALSLLRRNTSHGFQFLPRTLGRISPSEFHTSPLANVTESFTVALKDAIGSLTSIGVTFVIPQFWTNRQRLVISDACEMVGIEMLTIVDDFTAFSLLYAHQRSYKFSNKPRHVLTVDIGATSVKAYAGIFTAKRGGTSVRQTVLEWSEETGGYFFARAIAAQDGVVYRKGERRILSEPSDVNFTDRLERELGFLIETIRKAAVRASVVQPIDEVQVIGGASRFSFVKDAITAAIGANISILREFPAQEALAMGGVVAGMIRSDTESPSPVWVLRLPFANMTVECGAKASYCVREKQCSSTVVMETDGCDVLRIHGPSEHLPIGNPTVIGEFQITNRPRFNQQAVWLFNMSEPDAMIENIVACSGDKCRKVDWKVWRTPGEEAALRLSEQWVAKHREKLRLENQKEKNIAKIGELLKRLRQLMLPGNKRAVLPFPDEVMTRFELHLDDYERGRILTASPKKVADTLNDLESLEEQLRKIFFG